MRRVFIRIFVALCLPLLASCGTMANTALVMGDYNAIIQVQSNGKQIRVAPKNAGKSVDIWGILEMYPQVEIVLNEDIIIADAPTKELNLPVFRINGKGHVMKVGVFPILRNTDLWLKNIVIDCVDSKDRIIYAIGENGENSFEISGCHFKNVPEINSVCVRKYNNVLIEDCIIDGTLTSASKRKSASTAQILIYECKGEITVKNNQVKNCFGTGIEGIGFSADDISIVLIKDNVIDHVTNGGIVFTGGEICNVTISMNNICNTHCLGSQFENESIGGPNSAINIHGFRNAVIEDNIITNCLNSVCFDFDGSVSGGTDVVKGAGLIVRRNQCTNVGIVALYVVEDVSFNNNSMSNSKDDTSELFMMVNGSRNVEITDNSFKLNKAKAKRYYPISITDTKLVNSGVIKIAGNTIDTDSNILVYVNDYFAGECIIGDNNIVGHNKSMSVVNNSKAKVTIPASKKKIVWYK